MVKSPDIEAAIRHGLSYLRAAQETDGGFVSYSSPAGRPFERAIARQATFGPAIILAALSRTKNAPATAIRKRLARFLLGQKTSSGAFNYWAKSAPERQKLPYPDDLDDTFCALIGLYQHDPSLIDEALLAQTVKLLLLTESAVGGPYRTWLVPKTADARWLDTDIAVNANIAYFLTLIGSPVPELNGWLDRAVSEGEPSSPYYPTPFPVLYYLSRVSQGATAEALLDKVIQLQHLDSLTTVDATLSLTTRLNLGDTSNLDGEARRLLAHQRPDGSWPAAAYCADPDQAGQAYHSGGQALTTALAIEALQLFLDKVKAETSLLGQQHNGSATSDKTKVLALARERSGHLSEEARQTLLDLLAKLANSSSGPEIIELPQRFSASLKQPPTELSKTFLDTLSLANLYGWSAYTVYDDCLDGSGQPDLLPAANIAMRQSLACFSAALPFHRPYQTLIVQYFDTIDGANAWELSHCRFECVDGRITMGKLPDYGDLSPLAERSLGHILSPLAILLANRIDMNSDDFKYIQQALKHYLIARQLNDDAHDWESDLEKGHITFVVRQLLAADNSYAPGKRQLSKVIAKARQQFWNATLEAVCLEMRHQTDLARRSLRRTTVLLPDNSIGRLLDGIEASVKDTLARHHEARLFLNHYGGTNEKP